MTTQIEDAPLLPEAAPPPAPLFERAGRAMFWNAAFLPLKLLVSLGASIILFRVLNVQNVALYIKLTSLQTLLGVISDLGIERAHIAGMSMGGMIAQCIAIEHPERVLSLTSIMSTTGNRKLPQATKEAMSALTKRPESMDEDVLVEHGVKVANAIGSPGYRSDPDKVRERSRALIKRSFYPQGMPRQLAAIIADGDRRERLQSVTAPTLVIHGEADPLVPLAGGQDTAAHIKGSRLKTIPGMGHDLPLELVDEIADAIAEHAKGAVPLAA